MTDELLWNRAESADDWLLLLAHGAGAPMDSEFMQSMAAGLAEQGVTVVRFEFPYMQARRVDGKKRPPNAQGALLAHFSEVLALIKSQWPGRVALGGKSMGGRMASLLVDQAEVDALVCLGYPFHPPGKPEKLRTAHLASLATPGLIVQGERDPFGKRAEVEGYALSPALTVQWLNSGDHDFKPLKSSGLTQADNLQQAAVCVARFLQRLP